MKRIASFVIALVAFTLTGCLDSLEELTIAQDGSGTYKTTMDMSGMMEMMEMLAAMDTSANNEMKKAANKDFDSTMSFRSVLDSAKDLTSEQKALLQDATMHMVMKQKDKVFKINMTFPFKKMEDMQKIVELTRDGKGLNLLGKSGGAAGLPGMEADNDDTDGLGNLTGFYNMTYKNGLIERTIDEKKLEAVKGGKMKQLAMGGEDMMDKITFKTVIHLPRPVTKLQGEKVKLSEDKKTVTVNSTMADVMKEAKKLSFRIEY